MKVRRATKDDVPLLIAFGERGRLESKVWWPPIEPAAVEAVTQFFGNAIQPFVIDDAGMLIAERGVVFFSTLPLVRHSVFYVVPEKRGTKAAFLLLKAYEDWAREIGAVKAVISVDSGLFIERTGRFYEKVGYELMGGIYCKDL